MGSCSVATQTQNPMRSLLQCVYPPSSQLRPTEESVRDEVLVARNGTHRLVMCLHEYPSSACSDPELSSPARRVCCKIPHASSHSLPQHGAHRIATHPTPHPARHSASSHSASSYSDKKPAGTRTSRSRMSSQPDFLAVMLHEK